MLTGQDCWIPKFVSEPQAIDIMELHFYISLERPEELGLIHFFFSFLPIIVDVEIHPHIRPNVKSSAINTAISINFSGV